MPKLLSEQTSPNSRMTNRIADEITIDSTPEPQEPALKHLEQPGSAHAATDTHGDDDVFRPAALAFDQRVAGHSRAAHAVGMADRNRSAVDVHPVFRNAELLGAVQHLDGERFVQLPQADVVHLEVEPLQQLVDGV